MPWHASQSATHRPPQRAMSESRAPCCRYEGTGRSLSLKLLSQLRTASASAATPKPADTAPAAVSGGGRLLREVSLDEPIRYGPEDPVEQWLMSLLCLNAADHLPRVPPTLPHPDDCELFYVERDTLFSGHRVTEVALQRMMSLYVASHYKNTPNDLLLLSDAPAHHLFVLTAPVPDKSKVRHRCRSGAAPVARARRTLLGAAQNCLGGRPRALIGARLCVRGAATGLRGDGSGVMRRSSWAVSAVPG